MNCSRQNHERNVFAQEQWALKIARQMSANEKRSINLFHFRVSFVRIVQSNLKLEWRLKAQRKTCEIEIEQWNSEIAISIKCFYECSISIFILHFFIVSWTLFTIQFTLLDSHSVHYSLLLTTTCYERVISNFKKKSEYLLFFYMFYAFNFRLRKDTVSVL